jgi:hypothetical protein
VEWREGEEEEEKKNEEEARIHCRPVKEKKLDLDLDLLQLSSLFSTLCLFSILSPSLSLFSKPSLPLSLSS